MNKIKENKTTSKDIVYIKLYENGNIKVSKNIPIVTENTIFQGIKLNKKNKKEIKKLLEMVLWS